MARRDLWVSFFPRPSSATWCLRGPLTMVGACLLPPALLGAWHGVGECGGDCLGGPPGAGLPLGTAPAGSTTVCWAAAIVLATGVGSTDQPGVARWRHGLTVVRDAPRPRLVPSRGWLRQGCAPSAPLWLAVGGAMRVLAIRAPSPPWCGCRWHTFGPSEVASLGGGSWRLTSAGCRAPGVALVCRAAAMLLWP